METLFDPVEFPELIVGVSGPAGIKVEAICEQIKECLHRVNYRSELIKLTDEMIRHESGPLNEVGDDLFSQINFKMDRANNLRAKFDNAVMSRIGIQAIREIRKASTTSVDKPVASIAYIIRQLKLPEEVQLLRRIYGRQFILVSAYASETDRHKELTSQIRMSLSTDATEVDISDKASRLMDRDAREDLKNGQNLSETFHLGDVFIHGLDASHMEATLNRFFQAFFGRNDITPSKEEMGLYAAKSASLRSSDLSRQVGAAIFSEDGELITQGCNDVPKALGGNYWDGDNPDNRDIKKGYDPNDSLKKEIIRNFIERLQSKGLLHDRLSAIGNSFKIVDHLTRKDSEEGVLADAQVMDLTEYGRIVHAEMNAICDAARVGISVKNSVLYCTTFPCHNCAKHIIAAGVKKIVFLEPYPKSKAYELYADEIQVESDTDNSKVSFMPFLGISPYRYRDIFQKGKRKERGVANKWYYKVPKPMLDLDFPAYTRVAELWALRPLLGDLTKSAD